MMAARGEQATGGSRRAARPAPRGPIVLARLPRFRDAEHMHDLLVEAQRGDAAARRDVIARSLRWLVKVAGRHAGLTLDFDDALSEATIAASAAIDTFDASRGGWLGHVARCARWHLLRVARGNRSVVRRALPRADTSLDAPLADDRDTTRLDTLADSGDLADARMLAGERADVLAHAIDRALDDLSDRERMIVRDRLIADRPATLDALGAREGVSREAIRVTERALSRRLATRLRAALADLDAGRVPMPRRLPITRAACIGGPRPCAYTTCRYRLDGPDEWCALDVADRGGASRAVVARAMNTTEDNVRHIEQRAKSKIARRAPQLAKLLESYKEA